MVWLTEEERAEAKRADVYHVPQWEGDYQGPLKQPTLFEAMRDAGYAEGEKKLVWDLPGHGKKGPQCGQTYAKGCTHHEHHEGGMDFVRLYRHNCRSRVCPECYEAWSSRAAENINVRMATFSIGAKAVKKVILDLKEEMRLKSNREFHKRLVENLEEIVNSQKTDRSRPMAPIHVVLSPPNPTEVDGSLGSYKKLRDVAAHIARERGLIGGCLVPHPYRLRCLACKSTIPDYHKECPECGCKQFEWFWSFHFHVIGFGWVHGVKEGYARDGWVVKNLGVRESVFWTAQYILSHSGVSASGRGIYTITWFGKLSYRSMRFNRPPKVRQLIERCPLCEEPLKLLIWLKESDRGPPEFDREHAEINEFLAEPGDWRVH